MELQAKTCPTFLSEMVVLREVRGGGRCEKGETLVRVGRFKRGGLLDYTFIGIVCPSVRRGPSINPRVGMVRLCGSSDD